MSDIKLFRLHSDSVEQLPGTSVAVERSLQELIERYLETFLGVRFLAHEHATGKTHGGRIDTLGIDENGGPVIIEYKRALNENVINQGLYYLDWLLDHKAEFKLLVLDRLGKDQADAIEWGTPRLLCIAGDFTKFDAHAVAQINRSIELIRYRRYGNALLLFELVNTPVEQVIEVPSATPPRAAKLSARGTAAGRTVTGSLAQASVDQRDRFEALKAFLVALGDDVQTKPLKFYIAFRRLKNFACVEIRTQSGYIVVFVKVDPTSVTLEPGFTRDVRSIGHYGTGELEVTIRDDADLEKAKPLLVRSYDAS